MATHQHGRSSGLVRPGVSDGDGAVPGVLPGTPAPSRFGLGRARGFLFGRGVTATIGDGYVPGVSPGSFGRGAPGAAGTENLGFFGRSCFRPTVSDDHGYVPGVLPQTPPDIETQLATAKGLVQMEAVMKTAQAIATAQTASTAFATGTLAPVASETPSAFQNLTDSKASSAADTSALETRSSVASRSTVKTTVDNSGMSVGPGFFCPVRAPETVGRKSAIVFPGSTGPGFVQAKKNEPPNKAKNDEQPYQTNGQATNCNIKPCDLVDDFHDPADHPVPQGNFPTRILDVELVHVRGFDHFYVKPSISARKKLEEIQSQMNQWYPRNRGRYPDPELDEIIIDGHYAARISCINEWRRVVVRTRNPNGQISVQLLDDGGIFRSVSASDIRPIRARYCKLPIQAHHARIKLLDAEVWTPEDIASFVADANEKEFLAVILSDEMEAELSPFRSLGLALLQTGEDAKTKLYTFGGRLEFGYSFKDHSESDVCGHEQGQ